jgi:hypothetical protein
MPELTLRGTDHFARCFIGADSIGQQSNGDQSIGERQAQ